MTLPAWQTAIWEQLTVRAAAGSLPHALLFAGPAGIGKRAFAERLAACLLCRVPDAAPCGRCRSCELFAVRAQRDPEETRPDGSLAQPNGYPGHPDVKFIGLAWNDKSKKMYTEIVVEQIRELSAWLALTPQSGGAMVALVDPADALNIAAANALLKTLEEPSQGRYLILVTAHPARLPATIRSRCQRVQFGLPAAETARSWLEQHGLERNQAAAALEASGGNPALALTWSANGRLRLRDEVAAALTALGAGRERATDVANAWAKDDIDARLWFAAALVQVEAHALAQHARGPLALTADTDLTKLSAWFDQANNARELLRGPLRPELVVLDLLLAWQAIASLRRTAA